VRAAVLELFVGIVREEPAEGAETNSLDFERTLVVLVAVAIVLFRELLRVEVTNPSEISADTPNQQIKIVRLVEEIR